jgi:hypothetical protein
VAKNICQRTTHNASSDSSVQRPNISCQKEIMPTHQVFLKSQYFSQFRRLRVSRRLAPMLTYANLIVLLNSREVCDVILEVSTSSHVATFAQSCHLIIPIPIPSPCRNMGASLQLTRSLRNRDTKPLEIIIKIKVEHVRARESGTEKLLKTEDQERIIFTPSAGKNPRENPT